MHDTHLHLSQENGEAGEGEEEAGEEAGEHSSEQKQSQEDSALAATRAFFQHRVTGGNRVALHSGLPARDGKLHSLTGGVARGQEAEGVCKVGKQDVGERFLGGLAAHRAADSD